MYHIFKATDELKKSVQEYINKYEIQPYSNSLFIFSNNSFELCLIIYDFLQNLPKHTYGLVSSCGAGHHTLHLYKLCNNNQIVFIHSGINGVINKIEELDNNFVHSLRNILEIYRINWKKYEDNKLRIKNKIIHPDCYIPEVYLEQ